MNRILILLASFLVVSSALANDPVHRPFSAVCKSDQTHAYRYDIGLHDQKTVNEEWSTNEKFFDDWVFEFDGDNLIVDGTQAIVLPSPDDLLVAITYGANDIASSLWAYVVNIPLARIGAAQVNGFVGVLSEGIKTRVTNLNCDFTYL